MTKSVIASEAKQSTTLFEQLLADYDYPLEREWIAEKPAHPRDGAKLLVYNREAGTTTYDTFANLALYLPKNALLVFNDTKVIPARIYLEKKTGGKVEVLAITHDVLTATIEALANHRLEVGDVLYADGMPAVEVLEVMSKEYRLKLLDADILEKRGTTPLPPYLKHSPLTEDERRAEYQTIFAKYAGSSAAPTASLHFTEQLFESLEKAGIEKTFLTLHVGLGTFAPLTEEHVKSGSLHAEYYSLSAESIEAITAAQAAGRPIIPVGTTALRALESAFANAEHLRASGATNIFIREGYQFKVATGLITNFHVPRSSLMMLVATLVGREKLLQLYANAHEEGLTFLSFGDGMLII